MIKKLRDRTLLKRESSMLDLALEINDRCKIEKIQFQSNRDQRRFNKEKGRGMLNLSECFNGQEKKKNSPKQNKPYQEDKENKNENIGYSNNKHLSERRCLKGCSIKDKEDAKKVKKIDFFDELTGKTLRMNSFDEKDVKFTKSKILPQVKMYTLDNDVLTDSEQIDDAFSMMRDNLKETIKLITSDKSYLSQNLSRKIKFKK